MEFSDFIGASGAVGALLALVSTWGVLKHRVNMLEKTCEQMHQEHVTCAGHQSDRYQALIDRLNALDKEQGKLDTIIKMLKDRQTDNGIPK